MLAHFYRLNLSRKKIIDLKIRISKSRYGRRLKIIADLFLKPLFHFWTHLTWIIGYLYMQQIGYETVQSSFVVFNLLKNDLITREWYEMKFLLRYSASIIYISIGYRSNIVFLFLFSNTNHLLNFDFNLFLTFKSLFATKIKKRFFVYDNYGRNVFKCKFGIMEKQISRG